MGIKIPNITNNQKLIGVVILIFIALFYWFQIRPSQIKSSCALGANKYCSGRCPTIAAYNYVYETCLHQKGL